MAKKINISQPMVLDTIMAPFKENFYIEASDTTRQWYNTSMEYTEEPAYYPDRTTNPLVLTFHLSVMDKDSGEVYTPEFYGDVQWYYLQDEGWVNITRFIPGFTLPGENSTGDTLRNGQLVVRRNIPWNSSMTIRCSARYVDPRDSSIMPAVGDQIILDTNREASGQLPVVDIPCEPVRKFDFIREWTDNTSRHRTFTARVMLGNTDITSTAIIRWYASDGDTLTEAPVDAEDNIAGVNTPRFPWYISGQGTPVLTVDPAYSEDMKVVARVVRDSATDPVALYPTRAERHLRWYYPSMDAISYSKNSGAVRKSTSSMQFEMIVNARNRPLTEEQKKQHLSINWKRRMAIRDQERQSYNETSVEHDCGWGSKMDMDAEVFREGRTSSNLVYGHVYAKGPLTRVTMDDAPLTCGNEIVFNRS